MLSMRSRTSESEDFLSVISRDYRGKEVQMGNRGLSRMPHHRATVSSVTFGKILHEGHQCLHRFQRDGVVDRRTHAAQRLVTLQCKQACSFGFLEEIGVQRTVV